MRPIGAEEGRLTGRELPALDRPSSADRSLGALSPPALFGLSPSEYAAAVKADIYQVQVKLESLLRNADPHLGRSKKLAEVAAIQQGTAELDAITKSTTNPVEQKLKLLEHLQQKMIELEQVALQVVGAPRPDSPAGPQTRLSTYMAVLDKLLGSDHSEAKHASSASSDSGSLVTIDSMVEDALCAVEEQLRILEADVGSPDVAPVSVKGPANMTAHFVARLQRAAHLVEIIREQGVRYIQKDLEETQKTSRSMGDVIDKVKSDLNAKLQASEKAAADLRAKLDATSKLVEEWKSKALEREEKSKSAESKLKADNEKLSKSVQQLTAQLAEENRRRREDADTIVKDTASAHARFQSEISELKSQSGSQQKELHDRRERVAALESMLSDARDKLERTRKELKTVEEKTAAERQGYKDELSAMQRTIDVLREQNGLLTAEESGDVNAVASKISETLKAELREANNRLNKLKSNNDSLQSYIKDLQEKRETEVKMAQTEATAARSEAEAMDKKCTQLSALYEESLSKLRQSLKPQQEREKEDKSAAGKKGATSARPSTRGGAEKPAASLDGGVVDVVREEMRVMKAAFELKLSQAREEASRGATESAKKMRTLTEQLEDSKRSHETVVAKLKAALEKAGVRVPDV